MKKGRRAVTLDDLSPRYREQVEKQLAQGQPAAQEPAGGALASSEGQDSPAGKKRGKKRREMNATEREFEVFLKRVYPAADEISYEKHTLRWGEGPSLLTYTPDFVVRYNDQRANNPKPYIKLLLFEVKGAHAWKQDIVRFKAAVTHFHYLEFQLWEKDSDGRWHNTI